MTCVDGVMLGNTVTNISGINMNRDWKDPDFRKNPVIYEIKKYLKKIETKRQMSLFFFLDIKTCMNKPQMFFETNEFTMEDAFDRFLKIRFFPCAMTFMSPVFKNDFSIYYPKLKNIESSFSVIRNEFSTFLAYQLNINPILRRLKMDNETTVIRIITYIIKFVNKHLFIVRRYF